MLWLPLCAVLATPAALPVVAVDAGHGGAQPGAHGVCGLWEKDLTLRLALTLSNLLEKTERVSVISTRSTDETVSLEERSARANRAHANLFVSIHGNAAPEDTAHGVEIYLLSARGADRRSREVAARENMDVPGAPAVPASRLNTILEQLTLNAADHASRRLAVRVNDAIANELHPGGRGVLQAPFIVLLNARMAAVLVEVGFLSNAEECRLLGEPAYQDALARAITRAVLLHLASESHLVAQS